MILSDETIRKSFYIYPFKDEYLQPCSYDLHLDISIMRVDFSDYTEISAKTFKSYPNEIFKKSLISDDGYLLGPGEFILGTTVEKIFIPDNIAGRFEGKSSLGRIGLATHVTAGFIDPGFRGNITLEIKNENSVAIRLYPKQSIGQICFYEVDRKVNRPYGSGGLGSHYQDQHSVTRAAIRE